MPTHAVPWWHRPFGVPPAAANRPNSRRVNWLGDADRAGGRRVRGLPYRGVRAAPSPEAVQSHSMTEASMRHFLLAMATMVAAGCSDTQSATDAGLTGPTGDAATTFQLIRQCHEEQESR